MLKMNLGNRIEFYEHTIPGFVTAEIERCYESLESTVSYLKLYGKLSASTSTYVAFSKGLVRSIFLFERNKSVIEIVNGRFRTYPEEISRFADYIFHKMPGIKRIHFPAVSRENLSIAYPKQQLLSGEDIVISFAGSAEDYARELGRSTRKTMKKRAAALKERHPSSCFSVRQGQAITTDLIDQVVHWNRERMAKKGMACTYGEGDAQKVAVMAERGGLLGTVMVEDRMCAAVACCRVGGTFYMMVTGFDEEFEDFSLGMLVCYWTAMECLRMQGDKINMRWGRLPYKFALLGQSRKYDRVIIYRDWLTVFRNLMSASSLSLQGFIDETRYYLLDCERANGRAARLARSVIALWRSSRKLLAAFTPPSGA